MFFQTSTLCLILILSPAFGLRAASSWSCSLRIKSEQAPSSGRGIGASMTQLRMYPSESGLNASAAPASGAHQQNKAAEPIVENSFARIIRIYWAFSKELLSRPLAAWSVFGEMQ